MCVVHIDVSNGGKRATAKGLSRHGHKLLVIYLEEEYPESITASRVRSRTIIRSTDVRLTAAFIKAELLVGAGVTNTGNKSSDRRHGKRTIVLPSTGVR